MESVALSSFNTLFFCRPISQIAKRTCISQIEIKNTQSKLVRTQTKFSIKIKLFDSGDLGDLRFRVRRIWGCGLRVSGIRGGTEVVFDLEIVNWVWSRMQSAICGLMICGLNEVANGIRFRSFGFFVFFLFFLNWWSGLLRRWSM